LGLLMTAISVAEYNATPVNNKPPQWSCCSGFRAYGYEDWGSCSFSVGVISTAPGCCDGQAGGGGVGGILASPTWHHRIPWWMHSLTVPVCNDLGSRRVVEAIRLVDLGLKPRNRDEKPIPEN
jgi:hypothetical protein